MRFCGIENYPVKKTRNFIRSIFHIRNLVEVQPHFDKHYKLGISKGECWCSTLEGTYFIGNPDSPQEPLLITLVPKWTCSEAAVTLMELISSIEIAVRIGLWEAADKVEIAIFQTGRFSQDILQSVPLTSGGRFSLAKIQFCVRNSFKNLHKYQCL